MAKAKRRVKRNTTAGASSSASGVKAEGAWGSATEIAAQSADNGPPAWAIRLRQIAMALLGGMLVYVAYFPSDSILVETGDALWFCMIALMMWTATVASEPYFSPSVRVDQSIGRSFDLLLWVLALWMMVAAFAACPPSNLRMATNEAWLWVAGVATVTSARRLLRQNGDRGTLMALMAAVALGISGIALHQQWISLPALRANYLADPDEFLKLAGEEAPRGTARRMVYANRLLDGGPTGTFALANSLAAMTLAAVIIPLGVLKGCRARINSKLVMTGLVALVLVAVAALVATRSRSALLACLIGAIWLWVPRKTSTSVSKIPRTALLVIIAVASMVMAGIVLIGDVEWIAAAPASLEMRLHYWIATAKLVASHPVLGAGPGGFQSMYLQFRSEAAHETISDPHNFVFETLASGGVVGAVLLLMAAMAAWRLAGRKHRSVDQANASPSSPRPSSPSPSSISPANTPHKGHDQAVTAASSAGALSAGRLPVGPMLAGAVGALVLIWLLSLATMRLPDWQANLFGIPIGIMAFWTIRSAASGPFRLDVQRIASAVLVTVLVHLLVSGGWTVPGVAILVWLMVSILCHDDATDSVGNHAIIHQSLVGRRISIGLVVVGVLLMTALRFESIVPVQDSQLALARAEDARLRSLGSRVESEIELAIQADPWALEPARWQSEYLREKLVSTSRPRSNSTTSTIRRDWAAAVEEALRRAPENPFPMRSLGEQTLHFYQVFGRDEDLVEARRWIQAAAEKNPTDLSLLAQLSLIHFELGERDQAVALAEKVAKLSDLGNNIVRDLGLQHAMAVKKIGVAAANYPVYESVKDQFADRAAFSSEPVDETARNIEAQF